jgi:adenylylsulfate kinase
MANKDPLVPPAPIMWLMGPTSAGKTTLAIALMQWIQQRGLTPVVHWDGDQIRDLMGPQLGFSAESRLQVVRGLVAVSDTTSKSGILTIVSALTAHQDARELVAEMLPNHIKVHVHCSIDICAERDPKGLYRRAKTGEIDTLIGYNTVYEPPVDVDLSVDTSAATIDGCVGQVIEFMETRNMLHHPATNIRAEGNTAL